MDWKCSSSAVASSLRKAPLNVSTTMPEKDPVETNVDIDLREIYFLIMQFLSAGPCQRTFELLSKELLEHRLLPRRYHAWFSRSGYHSGNNDDDGISFPLSFNKLVERYPHVEQDHLLKLLKQLLCTPCSKAVGDSHSLNAADVPTLLGSSSFSLLNSDKSVRNRLGKPMPAYLRWPHMQADQVRGLSIREIGGGFRKHHRAPSIRSACYAIAKPSTMVQKMQNIKKLRGHRNAVYCVVKDWDKGGIGGLNRDGSGLVLGSFSEKVGGGPPLLAELLAINRGLILIEEVEVDFCPNQRIILESDSSNALKWINNPNLSTTLFQTLVTDIASTVERKGIITRHISRAANWEADELAKAGIG